MLNGDPYDVPGPLTIADLLTRLDIDSRRVAVEHNLVVLKRALVRDDRTQRRRSDRDRQLCGWRVAVHGQPQYRRQTFASRLIVGTGKYSSPAVMVKAHEASGADMITVAVRRVNISDRSKESLLDYIDTSKYFLLPNTAGCYSADDAIRTARLGREAGLSNWVKLEVIGDEGRSSPTTRRCSKRPGCSCARVSSCCPTPTTIRWSAGSSRSRRGGGDAAGRADRLGARHSEPQQHPDHPRGSPGCR